MLIAIIITAIGFDALNPYSLNLSRIRTGAVLGKYAIIKIAPTSLIPLANVKILPDMILFLTSGKDMLKNVLTCEAPMFLKHVPVLHLP